MRFCRPTGSILGGRDRAPLRRGVDYWTGAHTGERFGGLEGVIEMNEREMARLLAALEQAGPALAEAQRAAELATVPLASRIAERQRAAELATAPLASRIAETEREWARALAPVADRMAEVERDWARTLAPVADRMAEVERDWARTLAPVADRMAEMQREVAYAMQPAVLDGRRIAQEVLGVLSALDAAIADLQLSPEWEELLDDLSAADGGDAAIEGDFDGSIMALATHLAVPALIERIKVLSAERSEPSLDDAAWRLEREDTLWRATDDDRLFPMIIHGAVSVLEEVARRIADRPDANLRIALSSLRIRGTITESEQQRMMQVWEIRHAVAHGTPRAPREVAGFVLLRVRRGLLDLLNAVDAQEQRCA